jgi:hypothetical protein
MKPKICPTCNTEFPPKRTSQQHCSKTCGQLNPATKEKIVCSQKITSQKKYGVDHPMKTSEVVSNFKKSMIQKYGVEHALQNPTFIKKSFDTKTERYGDGNYNNEEQMKQTCLKLYGVDNARKSKNIIEQCNETIRKKHYQYLTDYSKLKNIQLLFSERDYTGYHFGKKYRFKCLTCLKEFETDVYKPHHIFCEICNPTDADTLENEIFKYVASLLPSSTIIKRNDRTILLGKELDIYIPTLKLAIEINGLYWHSESGRGINKNYHLNKYKNSLFHGVRLIHIFENEWIHKKEIIQSILRNTLKSNVNKLYARQCIIKVVSSTEKQKFLTTNHIQGNDKSSTSFGLYNNGELVSIMTFGKSRFDKKIEYEMIRYCNKLNCSVIGGASKLFKHFLKTVKPNSILSYSDKRFFSGNIYGNLGFEFNSNTPPNYHYISNDYKTLYSRMSFQKHKLKSILPIFDETLSEWENMKNNGYDRIWDCGHTKWVFKS